MRKANMELIVSLVIIIVLSLSKGFYTYGTSDEAVVTIEKSEMVLSKDKGKYLIFTKKSGVFENTDSWFRLKFDSSDMYNLLKEGKTYKIKYYGWRIGFFSMYPNIYDAVEVK